MKMDSLSKSSTASSSNRSSGNGGVMSNNANSAASRFRETAHFANIMVEFENDDREMAVDVPDSFVAHTKTPPKYPPPHRHMANGTLPGSNSGSGRSSGGGIMMQRNGGSGSNNNGSYHRHGSLNSSSTTATTSPPPPLGSRDHLKIERDGNLLNTREGPTPPGRGSAGSGSGVVKPTEQQSLRIKKYSEEILRKNLESERRERSEEFLRQSLRNSQRLAALKEVRRQQLQQQQQGVVNSAFERQESERGRQRAVPELGSVLQSVQRLETSGVLLGAAADAVKAVVRDAEFQHALALNQKLQNLAPGRCPQPAASESQDLAEDCLAILDGLCEDGVELDSARELASILCREPVEGLLAAHDRIARRIEHTVSGGGGRHGGQPEDGLLERLARYSEPNVKVVRIEKTSDPLGATVKNEGDAVVVGRIMRGGTAEASGLLHEGDEILEVNEVPLRGKNVNEVCDVLAQMKGTLTLLVVPGRPFQTALASAPSLDNSSKPQAVMHVKAHIDYDPEEDPYVPCRELGISFFKGDILHVINQMDPNWWQARREGEDDSQLPGLIPSASFQQQREAIKHTINQEVSGDGGGPGGRRQEGGRSKSTGFLCAKRSGRKKRRRGAPYGPDDADGGGGPGGAPGEEEVIAYEEVALYYPRSDRKRPVVLIGPPNIGRHELRQRLMQDGDRFAAAIPHTSRTKRPDEIDGQDYHFISRLQFEQDILTRKFVEHGEYEKSYYGTSLEAMRSVVLSERICVLNLHPQSLRILKNSDLMPFVVFVAPPSLEKLKRWKLERSEPVNDSELKEIIERAREMEETYGHYFDMVIIYSDPERAYQELIREINLLEREPQWVPASWLARNSF